MAVITHLLADPLKEYLRLYSIGEPFRIHLAESTAASRSYRLQTSQGVFYLRILEHRNDTELRFEECLLRLLQKEGLPVPHFVASAMDKYAFSVGPRKWVTVFQAPTQGRCLGIFELTPAHLYEVGAFLAQIHLKSNALRLKKRCRFEPVHLLGLIDRCQVDHLTQLQQEDLNFLSHVIKENTWPEDLPRGIMHGDLHLHCVRFFKNQLVGLEHFEQAAIGPWAYDLAMALVRWSFLRDTYVPERFEAFCRGYCSIRFLKEKEWQLLHRLCCAAAARFAVEYFFEFETREYAHPSRLYIDYRHYTRRLFSLQTPRVEQKFSQLAHTMANHD